MPGTLVGRGSRTTLQLDRKTRWLLPNGVDALKDAPSPGRALDHGSASFSACQHRLNKIVNRSGSIIGPSGSLAPPLLHGVASLQTTYLKTVSERRQPF
jgi:hypothetical protein